MLLENGEKWGSQEGSEVLWAALKSPCEGGLVLSLKDLLASVCQAPSGNSKGTRVQALGLCQHRHRRGSTCLRPRATPSPKALAYSPHIPSHSTLCSRTNTLVLTTPFPPPPSHSPTDSQAHPSTTPPKPGRQGLAHKFPQAINQGMNHGRLSLPDTVHCQPRSHRVQGHYLAPCDAYRERESC